MELIEGWQFQKLAGQLELMDGWEPGGPILGPSMGVEIAE